MKDVLGLKKVLARPDQDKAKAGSKPIQAQEPRRGSLASIFGSKSAEATADKRRASAATTSTSGPSGAAYASLHATDRDPAFLPAYRRPSAAEMESKNGVMYGDMI